MISSICNRLWFFSVFSKFSVKSGLLVFSYMFLSWFFSFHVLHSATQVSAVRGLHLLHFSSKVFTTSFKLARFSGVRVGFWKITIFINSITFGVSHDSFWRKGSDLRLKCNFGDANPVMTYVITDMTYVMFIYFSPTLTHTVNSPWYCHARSLWNQSFQQWKL